MIRILRDKTLNGTSNLQARHVGTKHQVQQAIVTIEHLIMLSQAQDVTEDPEVQAVQGARGGGKMGMVKVTQNQYMLQI